MGTYEFGADINKHIIGWREWVAFPKLKIPEIKAKIDTGARSSAIHAYNIHVYRNKNGIRKVRFQVHPNQRDDQNIVICTAEVIDKRKVKSSSGHEEKRITILTPLLIGDFIWPIELTLTNRDEMGFRLLIGRKALGNRFLVDPKKSFLIGK